jgi:GntR family transcriptional regulator
MNLQIDHNSPLPMHLQVEALLRKLIELPEYKDGALLPREVDLAGKLGISRNTVRQATNKLENEGLIIRKKGLGTKVAQKTVMTQLDSWHSFTQEMNEKGIAFINYLIKAEWIEADVKLSRFFNIPENMPVVKLVRLRGDANGPFVYFESFFHPRMGISPHEDFSMPLYELLENRFSTPVKTSKEQISARKASVMIAKKLKIASGDPVLYRERFVFDPGGRPVEYNTGIYAADKFTYSIEIQR